MEQPTEAKPSRLRTWSFAILVWAFLCVWLSAMAAGLTAGACRNDRYDGAKKLRFCNISLTASAWMKVFPIEQAKGAMIQLERGIALSQVGLEREARDAFERALRDARAQPGSWEQGLHQRIVQLDDRRTLALWVSVVESTQ